MSNYSKFKNLINLIGEGSKDFILVSENHLMYLELELENYDKDMYIHIRLTRVRNRSTHSNNIISCIFFDVSFEDAIESINNFGNYLYSEILGNMSRYIDSRRLIKFYNDLEEDASAPIEFKQMEIDRFDNIRIAQQGILN